MQVPITELLRRPGIRYLVIGGSVYLFEIAIILIAQSAGATAVEAVALSFILGTCVSFLLQKFVTFGDKRTHHKIILTQFIAVCLLVVFNFGFTVVFTKVFTNTFPAIVARTIALLITTLWNFYLYKTRIFKQPEPIIID